MYESLVSLCYSHNSGYVGGPRRVYCMVIDDILRRDEHLSVWHIVQFLLHKGFSRAEISDAIKRYVDVV